MDVNEALEIVGRRRPMGIPDVDKATRVLAAEVRRLREMEARLRTTATRPQGHGEKTADYRQARRLARFFLGEA